MEKNSHKGSEEKWQCSMLPLSLFYLNKYKTVFIIHLAQNVVTQRL